MRHKTRPLIARWHRPLAGLALLLVTMLALSACGAEAPEPSATPTRTLRPTFTPTSAAIAMATQTADAAATEAARATSTPTVTPTATDTPIPTDTPTPEPTDTPVPTNTPVPPTATPRPVVVAPPPAPAPTQPPPPPPSGDAAECAALGGDGCKWRIRGGPAFANSPGELKLTFGFIHSGRDFEAQGSYFVVLEKEGVGRLPISDGVRSWTGERRAGPNGQYNYEYKLGLEPLGGSVAGCYVGWVLDGNGERDSLNFRFCVPEGQGEVWIEFDQA